ncbi:hypothetical protein Tco_1136150, partial [Tanacetum coccineum]
MLAIRVKFSTNLGAKTTPMDKITLLGDQDLNAEYHERALLANQKRFYKRSGRDKESVSSKDEGTTKIRAFMAIAEDEPSIGKADARYGSLFEIDLTFAINAFDLDKGTELMKDNVSQEHVCEEEVLFNNNIGKQSGDLVEMPSEVVEWGMDDHVPDEMDGAKCEQLPNLVVKK